MALCPAPPAPGGCERPNEACQDEGRDSVKPAMRFDQARADSAGVKHCAGPSATLPHVRQDQSRS
jgi:hypothetical protein